jgi:DNA-directed RNA polymerase subunit M/transcription elongation factor TFIIS
MNVVMSLSKQGFENSGEITNDIIDGKIKAKKVGYIKSYDLVPSNKEKIKKMRALLINNEEKDINYTTIYTCPKCKKREGISRKIQNRGLDEGYSIRVECINCGLEYNV